MAKKIDILEQQMKDLESRRSALKAEVETAKAKQTAAEEAAQAAADAGDTETYISKKQEAERLKAEAYVKESVLKKAEAKISRRDIESAWTDYAGTYGKQFEKAWASYLEARRNLAAMFMALVNEQNKALQTRERCASLAGVTDDLDRTFPLKLIPTLTGDTLIYLRWKNYHICTGEEPFFFSTKELPEDTSALINSVVRMHTPFKG